MRREELMFEAQRLRHALAQLLEPFRLRLELVLPGCEVNFGQRPEGRLAHAHASPVDVLMSRHPSERRFHGTCATANTLDDPLEHAHVFAEPRPQELAAVTAAEPVDAKDVRTFLKP